MFKNNMTITAHAGKDAEEKLLSNGGRVVKFSIPLKKKNTEKAQWIDVICWANPGSKMAEITYEEARAVKKGQYLYIEGPLSFDTYTNKEGVEKVTFQITCNQIGVLDNPNKQVELRPASNGIPAFSKPASSSDPFFDSLADIPF